MKDKIAIILQARLNSQRCKNKMLRKFADTSLFELQLNKMNELSKKSEHNFYCAVGEDPFYKIVNNYKSIKVIKRDQKSVNSDKIEDVFNYYNKIEEKTVCFVNTCAPLLKPTTLIRALNKFKKLKLTSLTTVLEKKTWYFDNKNKPINNNLKGDTKQLKPIYECTHNFHIYNKDSLLKKKRIWNNKINDPYLFKVELLESFDIDTEEEFQLIEKIYVSYKESNL